MAAAAAAAAEAAAAAAAEAAAAAWLAWLACWVWLAGARWCAAGGEGVSGMRTSSMSIIRVLGSTLMLLGEVLLREALEEALALIDSSSGLVRVRGMGKG